MHGVTAWKGHHGTGGHGRGFGGSNSCLDTSLNYEIFPRSLSVQLAEAAHCQGNRAVCLHLLSSRLLMLTAKGNKWVTSGLQQNQPGFSTVQPPKQLETETWPSLLGEGAGRAVSVLCLSLNQGLQKAKWERRPTLWMTWHSNFLCCR